MGPCVTLSLKESVNCNKTQDPIYLIKLFFMKLIY
jgi:hypothetical protein